MGGGGGGSTQAQEPNFQTDVLGNLKPGYQFQENQYNKFVKGDELLSTAKGGALDFFNQISPYLSSAFTTGGLGATIASGGALSPEMQRNATQQALTNANPGSLKDPSAIASSVLNREAFRQQNLSTALGQAGAVQGLQTGGLNQLLGVGNAAVSQFTGLTNPIGALVGQFLNDLTATRTSNAQIAAQEQAQGNSFWSDLIGGALKAVGTIAAASDERLKTKIRATGIEVDGVPYKTFEYKTRPGVLMFGPMAQDVERKMPSAVSIEPLSGIKMVDTTRFPVFPISATGKAK